MKKNFGVVLIVLLSLLFAFLNPFIALLILVIGMVLFKGAKR